MPTGSFIGAIHLAPPALCSSASWFQMPPQRFFKSLKSSIRLRQTFTCFPDRKRLSKNTIMGRSIGVCRSRYPNRFDALLVGQGRKAFYCQLQKLEHHSRSVKNSSEKLFWLQLSSDKFSVMIQCTEELTKWLSH